MEGLHQGGKVRPLQVRSCRNLNIEVNKGKAFEREKTHSLQTFTIQKITNSILSHL
jgi:hypothetical protein